jgi:ABC-type lipoprotein release transport system permease subunit
MEANMTNSALRSLQREGEQQGDAADFDEHIAFYKSAVRITRVILAFIIFLLLAMYLFLVR